jgi:outer membrane lipoprotein-sorting protein
MIKSVPVYSFLLLLTVVSPASAQPDEASRIFNSVKKMEAAFREVEDYHCEVEQIFYQEGTENQRYLFKYYFKRKRKIRVDFYSPYPTLSLFYSGGDREVTVLPFRSLGLFKLHLSVDNPKIQTLTGQKINQTDMGYFIEFLSENLKNVPQEEVDFEEDRDRVRFWFQALDYIKGKTVERYRIFVSKEVWLPVRLERYTLSGNLIELSIITNYAINTPLEDKLFVP